MRDARRREPVPRPKAAAGPRGQKERWWPGRRRGGAGEPKARRRERAARPSARRPGRIDQERLRQYLAVGGVAAVILAAVVIAAFGYYQTQIAPRHKTVLRVGDTKFSLGHLERRMALEMVRVPGYRQSPQVVPNVVVGRLEDEGVLFAAAPGLGIDVTEEEIDAEIGQGLQVDPKGDPRAFASAYRDAVRQSGLHADEYRGWVRAQLLEERVRQKFLDEVPDAETQARARVILVATEEEARTVIQRLEAGEDFAALAGELSLDEVTKAKGGETDWRVQGVQEQAVDGFLFSAEPGARSEPLALSQGYAIVELLERQEGRPLTEEQRTIVARRNYARWLEDSRATLEVVRSLESDEAAEALGRALKAVGEAAPSQ